MNIKTTTPYSDFEILERILNGDIALFEMLIRRYNALLYKLGRSYNYNHADTQDLMQDTFINAYENLSKFESRSSFKTWIVKIMLNNCFRKKQKSGFKNEVVKEINDKSIPMFSNDEHTDPGKPFSNKELSNIIENALNKIPLDYRMVFSLREINGLSIHETAESLNISEANVKVRLNRAKTLLKKEIEKTYTPADIYEFNLKYCDAMVEKIMALIKKIHYQGK
jgi:RNA polymerase sigma factor (sigma-70 family)